MLAETPDIGDYHTGGIPDMQILREAMTSQFPLGHNLRRAAGCKCACFRRSGRPCRASRLRNSSREYTGGKVEIMTADHAPCAEEVMGMNLVPYNAQPAKRMWPSAYLIGGSDPARQCV